MSAYAKLRRRRQKFVDAYVDTGVGAEAMRRIGFKGKAPRIAACKLLALPDIKAAVEERTEQAIAEAGVRTVRVLQEIARVAHFNPKHLRGPDGKLLKMHELPDEVAAAISSEEFDAAGNLVKYRTHPKNEANRLLLQYLKVLVEQHEHAGVDGAPIEMRDVGGNDLNVARRIAFLLASGLRAADGPASDDPSKFTDSPPATALSRRPT